MTALLINGHREDGTQKGKHFADIIALWALKIGCEELRQLAGFCIGYLCIRRCDIPIKIWFSPEKGAFRYGCCYGCVTNLLLERRPRALIPPLGTNHQCWPARYGDLSYVLWPSHQPCHQRRRTISKKGSIVVCPMVVLRIKCVNTHNS